LQSPLSYVPEKSVRSNRELLRFRASLVKVQTGIKNTAHAILAKSNISHEYSDLFGKEGMAFLHSLCVPLQHRFRLLSILPVFHVGFFAFKYPLRVEEVLDLHKPVLLKLTNVLPHPSYGLGCYCL
jgi:hypothetical protein